MHCLHRLHRLHRPVAPAPAVAPSCDTVSAPAEAVAR